MATKIFGGNEQRRMEEKEFFLGKWNLIFGAKWSHP